ncbi:hypothetical protein K788_0000750 [Paraburkholderia caribensis MBA4]|uniref:Uncharacterized protein n=1 Tax=Paraburkholderia caribensis MBA4 TaxID=1323664 RepID=A0A0N7JV39_9BURK|nr:hypothetical protein K788_0000750 [Paraburkholderia caribensis MBA4]
MRRKGRARAGTLRAGLSCWYPWYGSTAEPVRPAGPHRSGLYLILLVIGRVCSVAGVAGWR